MDARIARRAGAAVSTPKAAHLRLGAGLAPAPSGALRDRLGRGGGVALPHGLGVRLGHGLRRGAAALRHGLRHGVGEGLGAARCLGLGERLAERRGGGVGICGHGIGAAGRARRRGGQGGWPGEKLLEAAHPWCAWVRWRATYIGHQARKHPPLEAACASALAVAVACAPPCAADWARAWPTAVELAPSTPADASASAAAWGGGCV
jgi:hypothetical protein